MQWGGRSVAGALHLMGLWPAGLGESARCLALTALLFLGPLFEYLVVDGGLEEWRRLEPVAELASSITTWRNIVIVCTELPRLNSSPMTSG